jgi:hypothetical protein
VAQSKENNSESNRLTRKLQEKWHLPVTRDVLRIAWGFLKIDGLSDSQD